jgi:hypothetical protein
MLQQAFTFVLIARKLTRFLSSRIVNIFVGVIMVLGGISQFFGSTGFGSIILGVYVILFGLRMIPSTLVVRPERIRTNLLKLSPALNSCPTSPIMSTAMRPSSFLSSDVVFVS